MRLRLQKCSRAGKQLLQLNQAASCGAGDGFSAAHDVHLREDGFHVRFHSALTYKEGRTNLFVAFALRHQLKHVDLAVAQRLAADALRQFGREMNRHAGFTGVDPANTIHQCLARRVLEQVTFRTGLNGAVDILVAIKCR